MKFSDPANDLAKVHSLLLLILLILLVLYITLELKKKETSPHLEFSSPYPLREVETYRCLRKTMQVWISPSLETSSSTLS